MYYVSARISKVSAGSLSGCAEHIDRKVQTPNADQEKTNENKTIGGRDVPAEQAVTDLISEHKITARKNAVLAVETVISISRDFFYDKKGKLLSKSVDKFVKVAAEELGKEKHVGKLAKAVLHLDEMTPHIHALSVPITPDGRLCAKHFLGHRQKYRDFQTAMGEAFGQIGVWRGVPNNRSTHHKVRDFYKIIDKKIDFAVDIEKLPDPPRLMVTKEAQAAYKEKVASAVVEQVRDDVRVLELRARTMENEQARRKGAESRADAVHRLYIETKQDWENERKQLTGENRALVENVAERERRIGELIQLATNQKQQNTNLAERLEKSESRIQDIPVMEIMARKKMTYKTQGEKKLYFIGEKLVFVEINKKLIDVASKTEVKTGFMAYERIGSAQNLPGYRSEGGTDRKQVFADLAKDFGAQKALSASLFHEQTGYQLQIVKIRQADKQRQQEQTNGRGR